MLNETNYDALYLAKLKSEELINYFELENRKKEARVLKKQIQKKPVKTQILEGAGQFLVNTGNKILDIA